MNFRASPHPSFGGFQSVPYATVNAIVDKLDDKIYNTLPPQPPLSSTSKSPKNGGRKTLKPSKNAAQQTSQATGGGAASKEASKDHISDTPPHDNPIEEPNIWCDIMKLEGKKHSNLVADGFVNWLRKTIDSIVHEVLIKHFILH